MMTQLSTPLASGLVLSDDQANAVDAIMAWRTEWPVTNQTFVLGGLAGTGKTTILSHLAKCLPRPSFACPTGKAANVLQSKGVRARTIHRLMYEPYGKSQEKVHFRRRRYLDAETLVIDEASMVNSEVLRDLCSYSKPILFVGDYGQLEPIGENPHLMRNLDFRLEQIHRQAIDSPIRILAKAFREGREHEVWKAMRNGKWQDKEGRCTVTTKAKFNDYLLSGMQVIVGLNDVRHALNARIRDNLGYKGSPARGEKLICLRNNARYNMFNGQECVVTDFCGERRGIIELELETDDGRLITAPCLKQQFGTKTIESHRDSSVLLMDFGYVLTLHKAQGSEWDDVLVLEWIASSWDAQRWRYTAATRAKNRLVYCA